MSERNTTGELEKKEKRENNTLRVKVSIFVFFFFLVGKRKGTFLQKHIVMTHCNLCVYCGITSS